MNSDCRIKTEKTAIGSVKMLQVQGDWRSEYLDRALDSACNGVQWHTDGGRDVSCDPLLPLAGNLVFLRVRSRKRMNDSAIEEFEQLKFLSATTRAKNPLDLERLGRLHNLLVDDRVGLNRLNHAHLQAATVYFNSRSLSFFEACPQIEAIQLESRPDQPVELTARLTNLKSLRISGGHVVSLEGLEAPNIEVISLDRLAATSSINIAPLASAGHLRHFSITGKAAVALSGLDAISGHKDINIAIDSNVTLQ